MTKVCVIEIKVTDIEKGRDFYSTALGFKVKSEAYLPNVLVMEHDGVDLILHIAEEPASIDYPKSAQSLLFFEVPDIKQTANKFSTNIVNCNFRCICAISCLNGIITA